MSGPQKISDDAETRTYGGTNTVTQYIYSAQIHGRTMYNEIMTEER